MTHTTCKLLPEFNADDWQSVSEVFSDAKPLHFAQAWLDKEQPRFQPATAFLGWQEDALWVYGELNDIDIYNDATQLNQNTWSLGDAFEIFFRPFPASPSLVWFEFHVTPENQKLQLRWPDSREATEQLFKQYGLSHFYIPEIVFESRVQVTQANNQWRVLLKIPAANVIDKKCIAAGDEWMISLARYDYTRGETEPILSSTSAYTIPAFDRQEDWSRVIFE
jgi:hypothetical protein